MTKTRLRLGKCSRHIPSESVGNATRSMGDYRLLANSISFEFRAGGCIALSGVAKSPRRSYLQISDYFGGKVQRIGCGN